MEAHEETAWAAFWRWFFFGALLGVVPTIGALLFEGLNHSYKDPWGDQLARGQLLIAAVGICGGALSRLIGRTTTGGSMFVLGSSVVLALVGLYLFTSFSSNPATGSDLVGVELMSLVYWIFAVFIGSISVKLVPK